MMQNIKKSNLVVMCSVFQECLVYMVGSVIHKQEMFLQFKVGKVLCGMIKSYFDLILTFYIIVYLIVIFGASFLVGLTEA